MAYHSDYQHVDMLNHHHWCIYRDAIVEMLHTRRHPKLMNRLKWKNSNICQHTNTMQKIEQWQASMEKFAQSMRHIGIAKIGQHEQRQAQDHKCHCNSQGSWIYPLWKIKRRKEKIPELQILTRVLICYWQAACNTCSKTNHHCFQRCKKTLCSFFG